MWLVVGILVGYFVGVTAASNILLPLFWAWPKARRLSTEGKLVRDIPAARFLTAPVIWTGILILLAGIASWFTSSLGTGFVLGLMPGALQVGALVAKPNEHMERDFTDTYGAYLKDRGTGIVAQLTTQTAAELQVLRARAVKGDAAAQIKLGSAYAGGQGVAQDLAQAVAWYRKAADQGEVTAQSLLGVLYSKGLGVVQDYGQAVAWHRKAADQGNAGSQSLLGILYHNGQGVQQDYALAVDLFRKAANQGDAEAQCNLGFAYSNGHGVPPDHAQAAVWFRKAAEQGLGDAQANLAIAYWNGQGVSPDLAEAHTWYSLAVSRAIRPENQAKYAQWHHQLTQQMTAAQIADAEQRARTWQQAFDSKKP